MTAIVSNVAPTYVDGANNETMNRQGMLRTVADPAGSLVTITPSDATVYTPPLRAVYVGSTGNVAVLAVGDTVAVTFIGVPTGQYILVQCSKVMSTNTTATSLVGLR